MSNTGLSLDRFEQDHWHQLVEAPFEPDGIKAATKRIKDKLPPGATVCAMLPSGELTLITVPVSTVDTLGIDGILAQKIPRAADALRYDSRTIDETVHIAVVDVQTLAEAQQFAQDHGLPVHYIGAAPGGVWGQKPALFAAPDSADGVINLASSLPSAPVIASMPSKGPTQAPPNPGATPTRRRAKPRFSGLILTLVLLLGILSVGAWAATAGRGIVAGWLAPGPAEPSQNVSAELEPAADPAMSVAPTPRSPRQSPETISVPIVDQAPLQALLHEEDAPPPPAEMSPAEIVAALNALAQPPRPAQLPQEIAPTPRDMAPTPGISGRPQPSTARGAAPIARPDPVAASTVAIGPSASDLAEIVEPMIDLPALPAVIAPIRLSPQQAYARTGVWSLPPMPMMGYNVPQDPPTKLAPMALPPRQAPVSRLPQTGLLPDPLPSYDASAPLITTPPYRPQVIGSDANRPTMAQPEAPNETAGAARTAALSVLDVGTPQTHVSTDEDAPVPAVAASATNLLAAAPSQPAEPRSGQAPALQITQVTPPEADLQDSQSDPQTGDAVALPFNRPALRPGSDLPPPAPPAVAETTSDGVPLNSDFVAIRPLLRPASIMQAAAELAAQPVSAVAVAQAMRPVLRPANLAPQRPAVSAPAAPAPAPAAPAPAPAAPAPASASAAVAAPTGQAPRSVASAATESNQLRLGRVALMGLAGASGNRRALVRMPNGTVERVRIGDSLDGGRVAAIGDTQLRYVKGGRNITLELP